MPVTLKHRAAIAGVYEHPTRNAPDKSALLLQAECAIEAVKDAGLRKEDVDAYYYSGMGIGGLNMADYFNFHPKVVDTTSVGGGSFEFHLAHAVSAIVTGRCNVALITYASIARSQQVPIGTGGFRGTSVEAIPDSFEAPYGTTTIGLYAMVAQRHMYEYGTKPAQLAEIAVACRKHASKNPYAMYRDPITVEDVLNSRMISTPLHLLDSCVISDGAGAVIVTSAERAQKLRKPPAYVLGVGENIEHQRAGGRNFTTIAAALSAPVAFKMAGLTPKDIDMAMVYDSFTITALTTLEDLGFCKKGQGGKFVEGGNVAIGGELPINTDGGGLSSNHPGMRGIYLLIEATRQLRGESVNQVKGCKYAIAHGTGGALGTRHSGGTVILGRE